ncbi:MAG: DinB family protein [Flavobacteriales bacterium]
MQSSTSLLKELKAITLNVLESAIEFKNLAEQNLQHRNDPKSWNALECIQHLNLYARFYHPEIGKRMDQGSSKAKAANFKSSWLGNYFAESMKAKEQIKAMKTFESMNPIDQALDNKHLEEFIAHQKQLLLLLERAEEINLTKVKTGISISKFIKLRLGDTFKVVVYHNERHILQAKRAIQNSAS